MSLYMLVSLSVCLSDCRTVRPSISVFCLSFSPSASLSVPFSVCQSFSRSVFGCGGLSVYLSFMSYLHWKSLIIKTVYVNIHNMQVADFNY